MNVSHNDLVELFTFFANMKGDIDIYKDSNTVRQKTAIENSREHNRKKCRFLGSIDAYGHTNKECDALGFGGSGSMYSDDVEGLHGLISAEYVLPNVPQRYYPFGQFGS